MTHSDGLSRLSARSVWCSDAMHRKPCATLSESLLNPPFGSRVRPVGGRRDSLTMRRIARAAPPTRWTAHVISMGHY